jgi:hypothetical protein
MIATLAALALFGLGGKPQPHKDWTTQLVIDGWRPVLADPDRVVLIQPAPPLGEVRRRWVRIEYKSARMCFGMSCALGWKSRQALMEIACVNGMVRETEWTTYQQRNLKGGKVTGDQTPDAEWVLPPPQDPEHAVAEAVCKEGR